MRWHLLCITLIKNTMGHFKTFLLGMLTAYGIYYITKKGPDGKSILDDLLANPDDFIKNIAEYAKNDSIRIMKEVLR